MKTAMQELIDILNYHKKILEKQQDSVIVPSTIYFAIKEAQKLLEKEKEQIINGHWAGWEDAYDYLREDNNDRARQAEEYYNETYEQNERT